MEKQFPIIVPLAEIDLQPDTFTTFTRHEEDRLITLIPKNGVLHGFRCANYEDRWQVTVEACGTIEPMPWLSILAQPAYHCNGFKTIAAAYKTDSIGYMADTPIACIALAPSERGGYSVIGSEKTTIRFINGNTAALEDPNDITYFTLRNYQPLPFIKCDVQVEFEDCTEHEMIERLNQLIIKRSKAIWK